MGESKIQTVRSHAMENANRRGILMWMLTLVLAAAMSIGLATPAHAAIASGGIYENMYWEISDSGVLVLRPTGGKEYGRFVGNRYTTDDTVTLP